MIRAERAVNVAELRSMARRRLPRAVFDVIDGGAGDEVSLRSNEEAFQNIVFRPRPLVDVSVRDSGVDVFGHRISTPVMLAPTGAGRMVHRYAELEVARAAGNAGTIYMQSTGTSYPLEEVAKAGTGPLWFQLYVSPARDEIESLVGRADAAGYRALAISIDTPVFGNRERDSFNRITMPYKIHPRHAFEAMLRPQWTLEFLRGNIGSQIGRKGYTAPRLPMRATEAAILAAAYPVTLDDVRVVRQLWKGPLLIKGIMRADECRALIDEGVDGFIVSNHGGRQLDGVPATVEVLPYVIDAVDGRAKVFMDGGIRRGTDVLKAIALGAQAVFVGRPYLYGLAVGGETGVRKALEILSKEVDRALALLGCRSVGEVDRDLITTRRNFLYRMAASAVDERQAAVGMPPSG